MGEDDRQREHLLYGMFAFCMGCVQLLLEKTTVWLGYRPPLWLTWGYVASFLICGLMVKSTVIRYFYMEFTYKAQMKKLAKQHGIPVEDLCCCVGPCTAVYALKVVKLPYVFTNGQPQVLKKPHVLVFCPAHNPLIKNTDVVLKIDEHTPVAAEKPMPALSRMLRVPRVIDEEHEATSAVHGSY